MAKPPLPKDTTVTMIPCLSYIDASAAMEWLCRAFGFEKHAVYAGPNGSIAHAELTFGNGMIMLGSAAKEGAYAQLLVHPSETGGRQTITTCVIVDDADAVYASAKAQGAEILLDIKDEDCGGRGFTCRDPEGYVWNFGTYDPWTAVTEASKG